MKMEALPDYVIDFDSVYYKMIFNGKTNLAINSPGIGFPPFDPGRAYRQNNYGFRSEDFSEHPDILVAGCSHTFGSGLEEHLRWGDVLAKKLNLTPQTIAEAGTATPWLVEKIMSHISLFGAPKKLVCLFPDPFRVPMIADSRVLGSESFSMSTYVGYEQGDTFRRGPVIVHTGTEEEEYKNTKFLKRPFNVRTVASRDFALYQTIRSIRFLEKYCNDVGIPLVWASWDNGFSFMINQLSDTDYKFDNFIDISTLGCMTYRKYLDEPKDVLFESPGPELSNCESNHQNIECDCYLKCHEDYRELVGSEQFNMASDTTHGVDHAHFGAHVHIHLADAFLKYLQ